jgi:hypothetical protein
VIAHKVGDEKSPAFWRILVSSDLQSLVSKDTAVFTLRAILVVAREPHTAEKAVLRLVA